MTKLLRINLTTYKFTSEELDPKLEEKYFGGMGVATAIFTREVDPKIDPFDEENVIIFSVGPFAATSVPYCGRHFVLSKSPLTGLLGEASSGGFWNFELRKTGYSHLLITGKSKTPVYLLITNDAVEFRDASKIWGNTTRETEKLIMEDLKDGTVKISSIGPAGENLVNFASIMNEKDRAAGRCGLGAVMGSKKLKAIAVKGTVKPVIKNPENLRKAVKHIRELLEESPMEGVYKQFGTPAGIDSMAGIGDVPIQNYTQSRWPGLRNIGANAIFAEKEVKKHHCYACPTGCTGMVEYEGEWVRWPEYETLAMMGANILVDNLDALIRWNVLVNDLGMDTISLGGVLAMFLELANSGKVPVKLEELGFRPDPEKRVIFQTWGGVPAIEEMIKKIAYREGDIAFDLGEGVRSFCKKHKLPEIYETHVKGLEVPAHEPRANNMTALDYITTPRGAFHCYMPMHLSTSMNYKKEIGLDSAVKRFDAEAAPETVIKIQDASEAYSACGGCIFGFNFIPEIQPWIDCLNAITGKKYSVDSWMKVGQDLISMKRAFNIAAGQTKEDDRLYERFHISIPKGGTKKNTPPTKEMIARYYKLRKWDESEPTLKEEI
ncbi:MAG: aldehyde ferredoxin oxidoreductase family protein [Candidatus Lokiarchaeota archaeon]|nr:aldehyde ferredoxin oxidoreductase family protein [Candidatus Lokiarchaeota archaeon]